MGKVQPGKAKKNEMYPKDIRNWVLLTFVWIASIFILYGTATVYFPDPIYLGLGLYGDIATAIIFFWFALFAAFTTFKVVGFAKKSKG